MLPETYRRKWWFMMVRIGLALLIQLVILRIMGYDFSADFITKIVDQTRAINIDTILMILSRIWEGILGAVFISLMLEAISYLKRH